MKKITLTLGLAVAIVTSVSAQWTPVNNGLPAKKTTGLANIKDTLYTAVNGHGVYYSVNNGDNWTAWKMNSKLSSKEITSLNGLSTFPTDGGGNHLEISGPSFLNYYLLANSSDPNIQGSKFVNYNVPKETINAFISEENPEMLYIATDNGVFYSADKQNWTKSTGLSGKSLIVNDLYLQENNDDSEYLFASTDDGIYWSNDNGKTFAPFTDGIATGLRVNEQNFFTLTEKGIYTYSGSKNKYTSFTTEGDYRTAVIRYQKSVSYVFGDGVAVKIDLKTGALEKISQENITGGVINSCTYVQDYLFICTDDGGVFRMPIGSNLSVADHDLNAVAFDVFPNPSNGQFTITSDEPITVELYNSNGSFVKSYNVNQSNSFSENLTPGLYFLKQKGAANTKKLVIE